MDKSTKNCIQSYTSKENVDKIRYFDESSDESIEKPQSIRRRRNSLIDQFRDFLSRSVDFSFPIDDPFEKEMY